MFTNIKFVSGIEPAGIREREIAISERKSHSAKVAHKRHKAKREAFLSLQNASHSHVNLKFKKSPISASSPDDCPCDSERFVVSRPRPSPADWSARQKSRGSSDARTIDSSSLQPRPVSITKQPHTSQYLMFNNAEWLQMYAFWLRITSPITARYASPYGEVYTRIIPQFAVISPTVRHMLLANAYIHFKFLRGLSADAGDLNTRAVYHYTRGVRAMSTEISGIEFLVAAKLGYVFEAMQNNFDGAQMHLKGYKAIIASYRGYRDDDFKQLTASHDVAEIITDIMTHKPPGQIEKGSRYQGHLVIPWKGTPFETTEEARGAIGLIIEDMGTNPNLDNIKTVRAIKTSLSIYSDTLRSWDAEKPPSIQRSALLLLFNLATALSPAGAVGKSNYAANPLLLEYIFKSANTYFDQRDKMSGDDRSDLLSTLTMLAHFTSRFVKSPECQERSEALMRRIAAVQPA